MVFNHLKGVAAKTGLKAEQMKARARYNLANSKIGALPVLTAVAAANLAGSNSFLASAAIGQNSAATIMKTVINIVVAILGVVAAIAFLWGLVDVSAANMSENGGPQKEKGQKKFIAAIISVLVAVALKSGQSFFTNLISSIRLGS